MPNSKGRRRRFGAVRELRSGQWQARYRGPDSIMRPADRTFPNKTAAEVWLTRKEAEILDGGWIDPDAGRVLFAQYAAAWIEERPGLRPKTIELYRYLLRRHLLPILGAASVAHIREPQVRHWRKNLLAAGVSEITVAKAYRLIKAIMNTALDDGLIRRNPCRNQGRRAGDLTRAASPDCRPGLRAGGRHRPSLSRPGPGGRVRLPPVGRAGRAAPLRR
jgi:hypothetical protein